MSINLASDNRNHNISFNIRTGNYKGVYIKINREELTITYDQNYK